MENIKQKTQNIQFMTQNPFLVKQMTQNTLFYSIWRLLKKSQQKHLDNMILCQLKIAEGQATCGGLIQGEWYKTIVLVQCVDVSLQLCTPSSLKCIVVR